MTIAYGEDMDVEIPVTEARAQFSELVNRVGFGKERVILTRHGKPLVALVPAETLAELDEPASGSAVLDLSARSSEPRSGDYTLSARDDTPPPRA